MANSIHLALLSFLFLAAVGSCSAFNVTQVLGPLRQFSTFSNYLAQVGVVGMMTNLKNVTILAVDNANMGSISGKSREEIKRAMTMHVIPEYYDLDRLRSLENGTALIRTIYVLTGLARGKDGMLLVTKRGKGGRISFASAILPRSKPSTVTLLRSVVVPSLNVSIFQVSGVIKAASKGDEESAPAKAPSKAPSKSPSKNASPPKKSPAKAPSPSKSSNSTSGGKKGKSTAPAPSPSSDSPAPAPSKKKKSDSPSPAPSKDAPSKSPAASKSPKAAKSSEPSPADSSSDDSPAPSKSSKGGSSSESPDSSSSPSPSDDYYAKSSPPAPAKGSESPSAESPSDEAEAPAEAPSGGASPMSVTNVGIMMTVMALWALAA
ncbi:unnamed protein product [Linum tenue]|uniref:FAS1 domain-containing protein n=1 Tax=Linum tenue TaxID=586396 RepID=A0AAV0KFA1_9ROSI|nr:unnamed protein product [Linum tenue]